jgi:hypothetical protein
MTTLVLSVCCFALGLAVHGVAGSRQSGALLVTAVSVVLMTCHRSAWAPDLWTNSFLLFLFLFFCGLLLPAARTLPRPWVGFARSSGAAILLVLLWILLFETELGEIVILPEYQGISLGKEVYRLSLLLPAGVSCFISAIFVDLLRIGRIEYGARRLRLHVLVGGCLATFGAVAGVFHDLIRASLSSSEQAAGRLAHGMTLALAGSATVIIHGSLAAVAAMILMEAVSLWAKRDLRSHGLHEDP